MTIHKHLETDLLIVGAGPAGLAAGIAARRKGFQVVIADSARLPIDKACGEGLTPDGIAALSRIGVVLPAQAGRPFVGIRFVGSGSESAAPFRNGFGLGIRRTALHDILVRNARDSGVSILWETQVERRTADDPVLVNGSPVSCRWIVGADGQKSRVRDWAGVKRCPGQRIRFGFRSHFQIEPWTDYVEVHWGPACQVFITPVAPSEICVAVLTRNQKLGLDSALPLFPALERRLIGARRTTPVRGALSIQRTLRTVARNKFILIGDASGSVDAIAGQGLGLSFQQAECLADALAKNDLRLYEQGHRNIRRVTSFIARLMLLMDTVPSLQRTVLRLFERKPAIFSAFLAAHLGGTVAPPEGEPVDNVLCGAPDAQGCRVLAETK